MKLGATQIFATYICLLLAGHEAKANSADVDIWKTVYPASLSYANFNCNICHSNIAVSTNVNPYGAAYRNAGRGIAGSFVAIQNMDSDTDGETNMVEIAGGSNPGSNASVTGNLPTAGSGGDNGTMSLGSSGPNQSLDYENANMLNQTSCGTLAVDSKSDNGGTPPPGALFILIIPLLTVFNLKRSRRVVQL